MAIWIKKKYLHDKKQGKWKYFLILSQRHGGSIILTSNLNNKETTQNLKIKNRFITETLLIWAEVNFDDLIMSKEQFLQQILWHSSLIRIDNGPIFYQEWFDRGITKVKHLKNASNKFLSLAEMQHKYSLNFNFCLIKHQELLSALSSLWNTRKNDCINNNWNYKSFVEK